MYRNFWFKHMFESICMLKSNLPEGIAVNEPNNIINMHIHIMLYYQLPSITATNILCYKTSLFILLIT